MADQDTLKLPAVNEKKQTFQIEGFEGPLNLMLHLIQSKEMDIGTIFLHTITNQYRMFIQDIPNVDIGAENLSITATLLLLKSKMLLPNEESSIEDEDPKLEILLHLLKYQQYRTLAQTLAHKEKDQKNFFPRSYIPTFEVKETSLLEGIELKELEKHFLNILEKSELTQNTTIEEEEFRVYDKILYLKHLLSNIKRIPLREVFDPKLSKLELIVTFLALLELIKQGKISIQSDLELKYVD